MTGIPPPAPRRARRAVPAVPQPSEEVLTFLQSRFPTRMAMAAEMRARSKHQTGAGYRKNILVRLIVSTFTDLGLGTNTSDVKSRNCQDGDRWVTVTSNDVILAFGMALNTFSTARSHVEVCYRVLQWFFDNPRQWDSSDEDGVDRRLHDTLRAYCRSGVLPPITSPHAATLTRSERDALLSGSRTLYESANAFMDRHGDVRGTLQAIPVSYEPEASAG